MSLTVNRTLTVSLVGLALVAAISLAAVALLVWELRNRERLGVVVTTTGVAAVVALALAVLRPVAIESSGSVVGPKVLVLVDQSRRDTAHRLLLDTELSLHQICNQLGYSEQSVLTRSCKRWFNTTPTAHRITRGGGDSITRIEPK